MFVFVHIPKTAGGSFLTQMNNVFSDNNSFRHIEGSYDSAINVVNKRLVSKDRVCNFVAGHFPFSLFSDCSSGLFFYTILRNPIDRVESLFRFYRTQSAESLSRMGLASGFSFEDFINSNCLELYCQINNGMSRQLASLPDFFDPSSTRFWCKDAADDVLDSACEFINSHNFGLVERLNDSNSLLAKVMGLEFSLDVCNENITNPNSIYLNSDQKSLIASKNVHDHQLYQIALNVFESRCLNSLNLPIGFDFSNTTLFRPVLNRSYSVYEIQGKQGFYDSDMEGFAWLREGVSARFYLQINYEIPIKLILSFHSIIPFYPLDTVEVFFNNELLDFNVVYDDSNNRNFNLVLHVNNFSTTEPIDLVIKTKLYYSLKELGIDTPDHRRLGLALYSVKFVP